MRAAIPLEELFRLGILPDPCSPDARVRLKARLNSIYGKIGTPKGVDENRRLVDAVLKDQFGGGGDVRRWVAQLAAEEFRARSWLWFFARERGEVRRRERPRIDARRKPKNRKGEGR